MLVMAHRLTVGELGNVLTVDQDLEVVVVLGSKVARRLLGRKHIPALTINNQYLIITLMNYYYHQ